MVRPDSCFPSRNSLAGTLGGWADKRLANCYNRPMGHDIKFVFRGDVSRIFDSFTDLLDIRIAFFSPDGREIRVGKGRPICDYCRLLRHCLRYEETCLALDRKRREEAAEKGHLIGYTCHGGMTEAIMPVMADTGLIGFVMIGQFRQREVLPRAISTQWKREIGTGDLEAAYLAAPCFDLAKTRDIFFLFSSLVQLIVSQRMVQVNASNPIQSLLAYIDEHSEDTLELREAAHLVHLSVSSLSQQFKQATGKSFRQFQIEKRLDRADALFRTMPQLSIGEVAARLGYDDPLYFSKLYKRHRGCSPKETLRRYQKERHVQP